MIDLHPTPAATAASEHEGELRLPGDRVLSYATFGAADGPLVVVLDGPGSRGLARAAAPIAEELGLRLVAPDRPGFFGSTPVPGRRFADWPADHAALLDALGAERAGVLGQSGGTPYSLVTAARLPRRIPAVALIGPVAPFTEPQMLADADKELRMAMRLARRAPWLLRAALRSTARKILKDPEKAADKLAGDLPEADQAILAKPSMRAIHVRASAEVLSRPESVAQEMMLLAGPWGFDLGDVAAPVAFWSGDQDVRHPTSHARHLAARLGDAPVHVVPGAATIGLMPRYGDALRFAAGL